MTRRRVQYVSRLPEIADRLEHGAPDVVAATAREIATAARAAVPVDKRILKRTIRVTRGRLERSVLAGRKGKGRAGRGFYAHMVEFGTVRTAAQPFLTPAAEAQREAFARRLGELLE